MSLGTTDQKSFPKSPSKLSIYSLLKNRTKLNKKEVGSSKLSPIVVPNSLKPHLADHGSSTYNTNNTKVQNSVKIGVSTPHHKSQLVRGQTIAVKISKYGRLGASVNVLGEVTTEITIDQYKAKFNTDDSNYISPGKTFI